MDGFAFDGPIDGAVEGFACLLGRGVGLPICRGSRGSRASASGAQSAEGAKPRPAPCQAWRVLELMVMN